MHPQAHSSTLRSPANSSSLFGFFVWPPHHLPAYLCTAAYRRSMRLTSTLPLLLLISLAHPGCAQSTTTGTAYLSLPSLFSASPASPLSSPVPAAVPSTPPPLSSLPSLSNLTSLLLLPNATSGSSGSSSSSSFSLFGSAPYSGSYSSRLSLMSASLPTLWRLELSLPPSVAQSAVLVELHLLLELNADQSFIQPAATTAANGVNSSVGSAVYTPITNSGQLVPLFPADNVALNYSSTASVGETILAALFSASPTTNVQLNYVMRQQPDQGHFSIDYIAFQPQLNQSLWYYFTIHSGVAGLDTNWQQFTLADALSDLPTPPPAEMAEPDNPQLLDVSSPTGTVIDEADFAWKTTVLASTSSASSNSQPPSPQPPQASSAPVTQYRIALVTNISTLLWANVAWQRNGDRVVRSSMSRLSSTQFLGPSLTLQREDVLTYELSWWDLSSNDKQSSPLTFVYRPTTGEAVQLTETAAGGSSTLPGGANLGDGQSFWGKLKQSAQSSLAPLPAAPAAPAGMGAPSLSMSNPVSSSAAASVASAVSSGLTSLLSSLSALQAGPAQVLSDGGRGSVSVSELPASNTVAVSAGSSSVSIQSLTDFITPLALIGSLAGLSSPPGSSSSLSSMSSYAGAAFCVLPCATSSPNSDVMVSCLGGCAQPFLPAGLSSSEATSVIDALHDYVVSNAQQADITTPSSLVALNQTTLQNATTVNLKDSTLGNSAGQSGDNSSAPASLSVPPDTPLSSSSGSSSRASSQPTTVAGPGGSILPQSSASSILNWLTGTQSTAAASTLPAVPSLLPTTASAPVSPASALVSGLSSGLGYLSTPLLAGLSSLSTGQVTIASNSHSPTGGITLSSFGQSVTLPLSVLSALLTPLLPPGTSTAAAVSTVTYVAGVTCMLPCVGGASSTAGVSTTSSCIGSCIDAVMPGTGSGGAKLVSDIDSLLQPSATLATSSPTAPLSSSHTIIIGPSSSTGDAISRDTVVLSSAAVSHSAVAPSLAISASGSPTLSLTGSASGVSADQSLPALSLPRTQ